MPSGGWFFLSEEGELVVRGRRLGRCQEGGFGRRVRSRVGQDRDGLLRDGLLRDGRWDDGLLQDGRWDRRGRVVFGCRRGGRRGCRGGLPARPGLEQRGRNPGDVLVARPFDLRRSQGSRRVIQRKCQRVGRSRRGIDRPGGPRRPRDPLAGHEPPERVPAEGHDERWVEDLELAPQVRRTGGDLVRFGVPVVRWPTFHDVRDEDVFARPAERREELPEEHPRATNERPPLTVLVVAGTLAHEHDLGVGAALPRNGEGARLVQPAIGAGPDFDRDRFEGGASVELDHAGWPDSTGPRSPAGRIQPRSAISSAISTAFVAAPLRRLSLTTQNASPRPPAIEGSWRIRPTNTSSLPVASLARG